MLKANKDKLLEAVLIIIILVVVAFIAVKLLPLFIPFIFAYVIAAIIDPVIRFICKRFRLSRGITSIIVLVGLLIILGSLGRLLIIKVIKELKDFMVDYSLYKSKFYNTIIEISYIFDGWFGIEAGNVRELVTTNWDSIISSFTSDVMPNITANSIEILTSIPGIFFTCLITIIATFFISKDRDDIKESISKFIPTNVSNKISKELIGAFGGYIRAQLILMIIVGTICTIGLAVLGNHYALLIGTLICMLDALPIFGSGFVLLPWAVFQILTRNYYFGLGLVVIYIVCLLTRQFLEPKLIGDRIGIHPLLTLMAIYIGLRVFGVFGIILGPFVLVFLKAVFKISADYVPAWMSRER